MEKRGGQRERLNREGSPPTLTLILSTSHSVFFFFFKMLLNDAVDGGNKKLASLEDALA